MNVAPSIHRKSEGKNGYTVWLDLGSNSGKLRLQAEDVESLNEAGQNEAELWKKMCLLVLSSMAQNKEQHPSTMKPVAESTTEKEIHSQKASAKSGSQRLGGRLPRSHSDNEDEERDGRKKRKLSTDNDDAEIRKLRLKCPFYLRRPEKYKRGSCRGEGFADMGKLKCVHT